MDGYRLLFNKYSVCDQHVLLVTSEFQSQLEPLSQRDFKAILMVMRALNAITFFNCGFNAGASIPHKHLQLIPYESFQGGILPIEEIAMA